MDKRIIAVAAALVLGLPSAAVASKPNPKSPSQACRALRAADAAAFAAQYKNFGACVSQHAKAKTRTPKALHAQANAAQACLAARRADANAFSAKWGSG